LKVFGLRDSSSPTRAHCKSRKPRERDDRRVALPLSVLILDHLPKRPTLGFLFEQMPAESLVPGYKLVESFGPDSEYETRPSVNSGGNEGEEEVEEEVEYVTLEISGIADVDSNLLTSYRLIVSPW
jgi:hypothetical protein